MVTYHQPWERPQRGRRFLKFAGSVVLVGLVAAAVVVVARYARRQGLGLRLPALPAALERFISRRVRGTEWHGHQLHTAENEFQRNIETMLRTMPVLGPHVRSVKWEEDTWAFVFVVEYPVEEMGLGDQKKFVSAVDDGVVSVERSTGSHRQMRLYFFECAEGAADEACKSVKLKPGSGAGG